ncbi:response regulator [Marinobacter xestospongiae]|uniref:histidine kinase n=1 Tax=Marinobacter xestospongiae TaxID=994319 RepID=A0ABU3VZI7_9GAMM|nr:response regulator [Marinobacter xestospongiae]MDV2079702.1 response regulator [Marinobacter xestospongiae]
MTALSEMDRNARQQLLMLCAPLAGLILLLTWLTYHQGHQHAHLVTDATANRTLTELRTQLKDALAIPIRDLSGIAQTPLARSALEAPTLAEQKTLFAQALYPLIYQNPNYFQVRWVQDSGREGVRIDIGQGEETVLRTPEDQLQDKSQRDYHRAAMTLSPFQLYVSELDLNREQGRLERPLRPVLRVALRLPGHQGRDNGYLIINVEASNLLASVAELGQLNGFEVMVTSTQGDWILHPDPSLTWASFRNHDNTVAQTNPALWQALTAGTDSDLELDSGHWYLSHITPDAQGRNGATVQQAPTLSLLLRESTDILAGYHQDALQQAALVFIILLVLFSLLSVLFYRRLQQAAQLRNRLSQKAEQLTDSNQFITALTNALPGLVAFWDTSERCEYANGTHRKWLDLDPETMKGMTLHGILGGETYRKCQPQVDAVLQGDKQAVELVLATRQGSRTVLLNLLPLFNPVGLCKGFISLITDISETAQARETLSALNTALKHRTESAENAARVKSAFLANMSHEIRTPMNAMLGLLTVLSDSGLNTRQQDYVNKISGAGNALLQVLNDILDLSKLEAGKLNVVEEPFSIEQVIRKSVQLFELGFSKKGLELLVWIDPALPRIVIGDDHRLGQVLNNLLGNALKFTESGTVELAVRLEKPGNQVNHVCFSVKDTGIGIPPEKQACLFDAFDQADTSTTRKYGGSGLGLAICKSLVRLMGGDISVASKPDEGSEFHFTLPMQVKTTEPAWQNHQLRVRRVLLVEDNDATAQLMLSYLNTWSVHCDHARTAEDGLARYLRALDTHDQYDTLLVDWILPGKDGVWLYNSLQDYARTTGSSIHPMVIMVTAHKQEDLLAALAQEVRQDDDHPSVLTKPVTPSALFNSLNGVHTFGRNGHNDSRPGIVVPDLGTLQSLVAGSRILLVEDNELNQEVALSMLAKLGLSADTAGNGIEALEYLEHQHYDLVLMDLHMPDMDGYEATRKIREQYAYYDLPVVAMTAAVFEEDVKQAKAAGMNDHIGKPLDFQVVTSVLCHWLNRDGQTAVTPMLPDVDPDTRIGLPGALQFSEQEILTRFQGDQELVLRLLQSFVRQYRSGCPPLPAEGEDRKPLHQFLHTLKGSAATLGLYELSQLAESAEKQFKEGEQVELDSLRQALEQAVTEIADWLAEQEPPTKANSKEDGQAAETGAIQQELQAIQETIARSRLPSQEDIDRLRNYVNHPDLGERFRTLLMELDEFRYQSAMVTLSEIERQIV